MALCRLFSSPLRSGRNDCSFDCEMSWKSGAPSYQMDQIHADDFGNAMFLLHVSRGRSVTHALAISKQSNDEQSKFGNPL